MIALEISVNGRHVQTACHGEYGSLEASIMWTRFPEKPTPGKFDNTGRVWSHGLRRDDTGPVRYEALRWSPTDLQVGDVVTIRIVEVQEVVGDQPCWRKMRDAGQGI
jgi:hypothetical protein